MSFTFSDGEKPSHVKKIKLKRANFNLSPHSGSVILDENGGNVSLIHKKGHHVVASKHFMRAKHRPETIKQAKKRTDSLVKYISSVKSVDLKAVCRGSRHSIASHWNDERLLSLLQDVIWKKSASLHQINLLSSKYSVVLDGSSALLLGEYTITVT